MALDCIDDAGVDRPPYYLPVGREVEIFESACASEVAIMLKGPTGCGKTRFVEHMAHRLGRALYTVACHEDLSSTDLVGRHLLQGGDTVWVDGPLTRAVREGAMCYLDEVVEIRQDSTVVLHPLADHRREMRLDRLGGERIVAAPGFALVMSYNPGYQSVLKDLKVSTRQRMVAIELGYPPPELELQIVEHESGVRADIAERLVRLAVAIRRLNEPGLREVASTRTLIAAGRLCVNGLSGREAAESAIAKPLTDDPGVTGDLVDLVGQYMEG